MYPINKKSTSSAPITVLFFFVLFSLPISVSALTMLDPGGSAVNPIYVEVVEDPWQSMLKSNNTQQQKNSQTVQRLQSQFGATAYYECYGQNSKGGSGGDAFVEATILIRTESCLHYKRAPSQQQTQQINVPVQTSNSSSGCGPNSYAGKVEGTCTCVPGYQWATGGPSGLYCVPTPQKTVTAAPTISPQKSNQQICQEYYGAGSGWNGQKNAQGGLVCDCANGFEWNSARNFCNIIAVKTGGGSWDGGGGSTVAPVVQQKNATGCDKGQQRIKDGSCPSYQRACFLDLGSQAVWTGKTNKTGDAICGCAKWYKLSSDGKSCVSETKNETSQINSNTGTATSGKSWWTGFMQWLGL